MAYSTKKQATAKRIEKALNRFVKWWNRFEVKVVKGKHYIKISWKG